MRELSTAEKATIKAIFNNFGSNLFEGHFDAKNGNVDFMYGMFTALNYFANLVSEDFSEKFEEKFFANIAESVDKVSKR